MTAVPKQWDADPWLLNTPDGVVDLGTGKIRPFDELGRDYMTKITSVSPNPTCKIHKWRSFLNRVTAGDVELQDYLKRAVGYCLTGVTIEHALFFLYGTGGNGKGVFERAISGCR
jgi:putative DNA primase/helicase